MRKKILIGVSLLSMVLLPGCEGGKKQTIENMESEISEISSFALSKEVEDIDGFSFRVLNGDLIDDYSYNECRLDPSISADHYLIGSWTDDGINYNDYKLTERKSKDYIESDGQHYLGVLNNDIYYAASGEIARSLYYIDNGTGSPDPEDSNDEINNYNEVNSLLLNCRLDDVKITRVKDCSVIQENGMKKLVADVSLSLDSDYNGVAVILESSDRQGIFIAGKRMGSFSEQEKLELINGVDFSDSKAAILTNYGKSQAIIDTNGIKVQFDAPDIFDLNYTLSPGMIERSDNKEEYWGINEYLGEVMAYTCISIPEDFPREYIMRAYKNCYDKSSELEQKRATLIDKNGNKWERHVFFDNEYNIADGAILYVLDKDTYVCYLPVLTNESKTWTRRDTLIDLSDQMIQSINITAGDSKKYTGYSESVRNLYDLYAPVQDTAGDSSKTKQTITGKIKKSN